MGYLFVFLYVVGDLWLYARGVRPENSIWRDEIVGWM